MKFIYLLLIYLLINKFIFYSALLIYTFDFLFIYLVNKFQLLNLFTYFNNKFIYLLNIHLFFSYINIDDTYLINYISYL